MYCSNADIIAAELFEFVDAADAKFPTDEIGRFGFNADAEVYIEAEFDICCNAALLLFKLLGKFNAAALAPKLCRAVEFKPNILKSPKAAKGFGGSEDGAEDGGIRIPPPNPGNDPYAFISAYVFPRFL